MLLTVRKAAEYSKVSPSAIYYRINKGHIDVITELRVIKHTKDKYGNINPYYARVQLIDTDDLNKIYYKTRDGEKQHSRIAKNLKRYYNVYSSRGKMIFDEKKFLTYNEAQANIIPPKGFKWHATVLL